MTDGDWGNPAGRGFAKRYIRQLRYENVTIEVHAHSTEIFLEFFRTLSNAFVIFPPGVTGYRSGGIDLDALGLSVWLPNTTIPPQGKQVAAALGLTLTTEGDVVFRGTIEEADAITRRIIERRTTGLDSIENATVEIYRPGTRALDIGDIGPDVHFLQLFMVDPHDDGVFTPSLAKRVLEFRTIRGIGEGGVDQDFWLSMFPERTVQVSSNDGGMWVRMVQALLVALDYSANPVTSMFGTRTYRDVRSLQEANSLRVNGFVRGPEWGVLVHRPVDGFPF